MGRDRPSEEALGLAVPLSPLPPSPRPAPSVDTEAGSGVSNTGVEVCGAGAQACCLPPGPLGPRSWGDFAGLPPRVTAE